MDKLFVSHGLKVEIIEHNEVARNLGKGPLSDDDCKTILFAAEQLQFSDDQVINFECFETSSKYVSQFSLRFESDGRFQNLADGDMEKRVSKDRRRRR